MRLIKRKTLLLCIELWTWIKENPLRNTSDWPRYAENGGDVPAMASSCPCCEYKKQGPTRRTCCIIKGWSLQITDHCMDSDSPYARWCKARRAGDKSEASEQAGRIVELAQRALAKL